MSEQNNNHTMQVGIGYTVDTSHIEQLSQNIENVNRFTQRMAEGFRDSEVAMNGLADAQERYQQAVNNTRRTSSAYVRQIQDEVRANTIARRDEEDATQSAIRQLNEYAQILREILNLRLSNQERSYYVRELAQTNTAIDNYQKQALAGHIKYENAKLAETRRVNQEALRAERDRIRSLKEQWQQGLREYQSIQQQMNAQSSLKDFTNGAAYQDDMITRIVKGGVSLAAIRAITGEIQNAAREIIDIDYKLVNTQRIMQDFSKETANFLMDNASEIAKATNIQITDAQEIQSAWVRINDAYAKNKELLSEISMLTSKFMNVGEIENAEDAVTLLNASLLQFNVNANDAIEKSEEFLNKWAYMADKTAMGTADEYGEAISKFGAQLDALGGSMDDAIALSSVMADSLAKNGAEAGNALKTFTTYLNREKTVNLFSKIAEDLGDTSFQLMDANGRFKDFEDTLRTVAQAYKMYSEAGNDAMAQSILNAVGATRQRDSALAILNSVNSGQYDTYLKQVNDESAGGYLDEQNIALMETFKAQWNDLKVSIEEASMALARSGILDAVGLLMNGFSGLLSVVAQIPEPVLNVVNAFVGLKAAQAAGEYIGNLTGITQKYQSLINQGTSAEIEHANSIIKSANAYMVRMERMRENNELNESVLSVYLRQKTQLDSLTDAYNRGEITATEYSTAVTNLIGKQQLESSTLERNTQELLDNTNGIQQRIITIDGETVAVRENVNAKNNDTLATKNNTNAKQRGIVATLANIKNIAKETFETKKLNNAKVAEALTTKIMNSNLLKLITTESTANLVTNGLSGAFSLLGTAAAGASAGAAAFMAALSPILTVVSIGTTLWSFGSMLFGNTGDSAEEASQQLNELQSELDETKTRLEELQDLDRKSGLTSGERAELEYLEEKNKLLEESIRLKQQEKNNSEWNDKGGFLGWGTSDNSQESLQNTIDKYKQIENTINSTMSVIEKGTKRVYNGSSYTYSEVALTSEEIAAHNKTLAESNEELRLTAASLIQEYYRLDENIKNGYYSGDTLVDVTTYRDTLAGMLPTLQGLTEEHYNLSDSIRTMTTDTEAYAEEIGGLKDKVKTLNDLFDEYNKEGYLSYETVSKLIAENSSYARYLVKVGDQYKLNKVAENELNQANQDIIESTDEIIENLGKVEEAGQLVTEGMTDAVDAVYYFTSAIANTFADVPGVSEFVNELTNINVSLLQGKSTIEEYNTSINDLINNTDFSMMNESLENASEEAKELAASQQALFTSLTQEVANYMQEATNSLYQGQMSVADYITTLQGVNENLLDMYAKTTEIHQTSDGVWLDQNDQLDEYAMKLQTAINGLNGMSEAAQFLSENYEILSQISSATAEQMANDSWWTQGENAKAYNAMYSDFSTLMGNLHETNWAAWNSISQTVAESAGLNRDNVFTSTGEIATNAQISASAVGAGTTAMMQMVGDAAGTATSAAGDVFSKLGEVVENFDYTIDFGVEGSINAGGNALDLLLGKDFTPTSTLKLKINGHGGNSVKGLADSLKNFGTSLNQLAIDDYLSKINSYKPISGGNLSGQLSDRDLGTGGSGSKTDRETPATRTPTGKSDAEKAAEKAAKAAEEALKAIEKYTKEYTKNVESMYDRIAKALKKKYQEQYDERKKLLEKEHNARVEQIQAEIDAINGNRPEDKQSKLAGLEKKYQQWLADDSTLGKAKQKEYLDQIKELKKEIKLDELEQKLEDENDRYDKSIDQDSQFYDAILKKLDKQMTDEMLYREAADMIRNNKTQEIVDLLTEYDAQWDGWATLMGKTAGEIIAEEVALAIANYKDVKDGTITEDGGKNTNAITGGATSISKKTPTSTMSNTSSSTTTKAVTKGGKAKITNTSAGMYYTSTSGSAVGNWSGYTGNYYVVNDNAGRAALAKSNNINAAIGWIDKKYLVGLATGGYTGNNEGLALLHQKERVLNAQQTSAFEHLVYDFLPKISSELLNPIGDTYNGNNVTFNKELVKVDIGTVVNNKQFDVDNGIDNLDRAFRQSLKKSGINLKRG